MVDATVGRMKRWETFSLLIFSQAKWQLSDQQCCVVHGVQDVAAGRFLSEA
jgi:hypothetical protein